jgi:hypothetical protein
MQLIDGCSVGFYRKILVVKKPLRCGGERKLKRNTIKKNPAVSQHTTWKVILI